MRSNSWRPFVHSSSPFSLLAPSLILCPRMMNNQAVRDLPILSTAISFGWTVIFWLTVRFPLFLWATHDFGPHSFVQLALTVVASKLWKRNNADRPGLILIFLSSFLYWTPRLLFWTGLIPNITEKADHLSAMICIFGFLVCWAWSAIEPLFQCPICKLMTEEEERSRD